jgi:hypothetical protein
MYTFLNSNLFQTVVTFFVGTFAICLYLKQKSDHKREAAKIILTEIQAAESMIERVRDSLRNGKLEIDSIVMPNDSWTLYKHLFSKYFDRDEWDAITRFYAKSKLIDESTRYNNSAFANDVEQIRTNKQKVLADFARELVEDVGKNQFDVKTQVDLFDKKVAAFDKLYMDKQKDYLYSPQKPINDAKIYLEDLKPISISTVGQKLKKLAR